MGTTIAPMGSDEIFHDGQIVALVVGETFEAAREGAHRLGVRYEEQAPTATFDSPGAETVAGSDASKSHEDPKVGDFETAFAQATVTIDRHYATATEHHNPIELFTTACAWKGDKLTVWESSQNMWGVKTGLAKQLGMKPENIHAISPFVGGAFGRPRLADPAHRHRGARRETCRPSGQADDDARAGLHHRHLSR